MRSRALVVRAILEIDASLSLLGIADPLPASRFDALLAAGFEAAAYARARFIDAAQFVLFEIRATSLKGKWEELVSFVVSL